MNRISIDDYYLNIAAAVSKRSTCLRRHYGAVIVKNGEIIGTGYNGSARGTANCCDIGYCHRVNNEHNDGDYGKCPAVHAEMNALLSVARKDSIGATLYLYGEEENKTIDAEPCPICSRLIINAGIKKVISSTEEYKEDHVNCICDSCIHSELGSSDFPCFECVNHNMYIRNDEKTKNQN